MIFGNADTGMSCVHQSSHVPKLFGTADNFLSFSIDVERAMTLADQKNPRQSCATLRDKRVESSRAYFSLTSNPFFRREFSDEFSIATKFHPPSSCRFQENHFASTK